jgi:hypothetical protein
MTITLSEKIKAAREVYDLGLLFAQQYFFQFAKLRKIKGYDSVSHYSYFEDEVFVDYLDDEGDYVSLKWSYQIGSYGSYEDCNEYVMVPLETLEQFLITPEKTAETLALQNTEKFRKQEEERERIKQEKVKKAAELRRNKQYQEYLKLKAEFEDRN